MVEKVRKAVIIAAGYGTRMMPVTKVVPKILLPIGNKPVISYLLEEIINSGIKDVVIITRPKRNMIRSYLTLNKNLNKTLSSIGKKDVVDDLTHSLPKCKLSFVEQKEPLGWVNAILQTKKLVGKNPFVTLFDDIIIKSKIPATRQVCDIFEKTGKCVNGSALRYLFKPNTFKVMEEIDYSLGEEHAIQTLRKRLREKRDIIDYPLDGTVYNTGDPTSYRKTFCKLSR